MKEIEKSYRNIKKESYLKKVDNKTVKILELGQLNKLSLYENLWIKVNFLGINIKKRVIIW